MSEIFPEPNAEAPDRPADTPPVEPPVIKTTAAERPRAPEIKPPSAARRASNRVFGKETRAGRFFRGLLRGFLFAVIFFALGVAGTYFYLYRPLNRELEAARVRSTETSVDYQRAQTELERAQASQKDAQGIADDAQGRLTTELTRVQILRAVSSLKTAQIAIQANDKAAAVKAINTAEETLKAAKPRLDQVDTTAYSTLQALFTLVRNGLDRDLKIASQDMDRLLTELARMDNTLK